MVVTKMDPRLREDDRGTVNWKMKGALKIYPFLLPSQLDQYLCWLSLETFDRITFWEIPLASFHILVPLFQGDMLRGNDKVRNTDLIFQ